MSWFSELLHPGRAYGQAQTVEEEHFNKGQGFRQPYINRGETAGANLETMFQKLMNPGELTNEWSKGYETSPYAKQLQQEAQTGGLDAASAMGLGGSSAALSNIQKGSADIMQKDRQQYMNDMMQKYMAAMGLGQNLYGTGANMSSDAAQGEQTLGQDTAGLTYGKNSAGRNILMKLLGGGAGLLGGLGSSFGFGGMTSDMYGGA